MMKSNTHMPGCFMNSVKADAIQVQPWLASSPRPLALKLPAAAAGSAAGAGG